MTTRELIEELKALPGEMLDREVGIIDCTTGHLFQISPFDISSVIIMEKDLKNIFTIFKIQT